MAMNLLQDRRVQLAGGTLAALLLAIILASVMTRPSKPAAAAADAPAAKGALQVDLGHDEARVSQTKPLRCFVNGQYVGDFPVLECAKRNGVAAQALDVGLDPATGQIAGGSAPLQPLPAPTPVTAPAPSPAAEASIATEGPIATGPADCLRYAEGGWRGAGGVGSLNQCVRILFDNRCVRAGDALYGRYGALTLRLVPGRVEMSADNKTFRTLVTQDEDCRLPPV